MAIGYATLPVIPSFAGFGTKLGAGIAAPSAAAGATGGAAAGKTFKTGMLASLKTLAAPLAALFGIGAIIAWGKASVASIGNIQALNAQTNSVIAATGSAANVSTDGVLKMAQSLENLTGTEKESIQKGANFLLTFKNIKNELGEGNDIFDQTTEIMTDMSRATGGDMQGAALQLGKALNDPIKGAAALAEVGVAFTDQQKDQILTMQESGDMMGAQRVILAELQGQFAGSGAAYAGTFQGKMDLLSYSLGTLGETIFSGVVPALVWMAGIGVTAFDWINANITTVAIFTGLLLTAAVVVKLHGAAMAISAAGGMKSYLVGTKLAAAGQWLWNAALTANPIGIIIVAVVALVGALIWFFTQTELGQQVWQNITTFIGTAVTWLWEVVLQPVFTAIGAIFTWLYENIIMPIVIGILIYVGIWAAIFTWLWETVISPVFGFIGAIFTWLYKNVLMPVINNIVAGVKVWGAIFTWLYENIIQPVFAAIGAAFAFVWNNGIKPPIDAIRAAIQFLGDKVKSIFSGIAGFIGSAFQAVLGVVRGPINGIIGMVNNVIGKLNSISVKIPAWVPKVGGQTFGLSIPRIPSLATGGDVAARAGGTIAILGEGGQAETVSNLGTTNRALEAMRALAERALGEGDARRRGDVNLYITNPVGEPTEETIRTQAQLIGATLSV